MPDLAALPARLTSARGLIGLVLVLAGCQGAPAPVEDTLTVPGSAFGPYPARWWQPAPEKDKPWWEILPQAADPARGEVILSKRNELGLLSNFTAAPFTFRGQRYASLEGFWQCMKYPEGPDDPRSKLPGWKRTRADVRALTAFEAHTAGVEAEAILKAGAIDWISFEGKRMRYLTDPTDIDAHHALIVAASWAKVRQNPKVKAVLLATGDLTLKPDHLQGKEATKSWRYFTIYEQLRAALRRGEAGPPSD